MFVQKVVPKTQKDWQISWKKELAKIWRLFVFPIFLNIGTTSLILWRTGVIYINIQPVWIGKWNCAQKWITAKKLGFYHSTLAASTHVCWIINYFIKKSFWQIQYSWEINNSLHNFFDFEYSRILLFWHGKLLD
jgi:hypothetical protein